MPVVSQRPEIASGRRMTPRSLGSIIQVHFLYPSRLIRLVKSSTFLLVSANTMILLSFSAMISSSSWRSLWDKANHETLFTFNYKVYVMNDYMKMKNYYCLTYIYTRHEYMYMHTNHSLGILLYFLADINNLKDVVIGSK